MITYTEEIVMVRETCCSCGIVFGMEEKYRDKLKETEEIFYCPNGHRQHYTESKEMKLKKELKLALENEAWWRGRAESNATEAESVKRMLSATRGQLTKIKKRIADSVCPCCHRQFVDLHRHMTSQHPDYIKEENSVLETDKE